MYQVIVGGGFTTFQLWRAFLGNMYQVIVGGGFTTFQLWRAFLGNR